MGIIIHTFSSTVASISPGLTLFTRQQFLQEVNNDIGYFDQYVEPQWYVWWWQLWCLWWWWNTFLSQTDRLLLHGFLAGLRLQTEASFSFNNFSFRLDSVFSSGSNFFSDIKKSLCSYKWLEKGETDIFWKQQINFSLKNLESHNQLLLA